MVNLCKEHNVELHIGFTIQPSCWQYWSIFIRLAVGCWLRNLRNHVKFRENSKLWQVKVIQGHRSWCQSKAHMITLDESPTVFEILMF